MIIILSIDLNLTAVIFIDSHTVLLHTAINRVTCGCRALADGIKERSNLGSSRQWKLHTSWMWSTTKETLQNDTFLIATPWSC